MSPIELFAWVGIAVMSAALVGIVAYIVKPLFTRTPPDLEHTTRRLEVPRWTPATARGVVRRATLEQRAAAERTARDAIRRADLPLWPPLEQPPRPPGAHRGEL